MTGSSRAGRFVDGIALRFRPLSTSLVVLTYPPPPSAPSHDCTLLHPLALYNSLSLSLYLSAFPADHLAGDYTPINNEYMNMKIFMRICRCMYALWLHAGTSNERSSDTTALHSAASSRIASIRVSGSCANRNLSICDSATETKVKVRTEFKDERKNNFPYLSPIF